jgi:hypothetical protein
MDNKERKYGLISAPDGFYIGRIMKSGMLSKDSRKISEQEIITMFEDLLRRNKAETGRSVLSLFSHGKPVLVAKLDPDIRECGVLPQPTPHQAMRRN